MNTRICYCGGLRVDGVCNRCGRKRQTNKRGATSGNYKTPRWRRHRRLFLQRNPLCVQCKQRGKLSPATVVDHIKRYVDEFDDLFWDDSNHQALCVRCHNRKTALENTGRYDAQHDASLAMTRESNKNSEEGTS